MTERRALERSGENNTRGLFLNRISKWKWSFESQTEAEVQISEGDRTELKDSQRDLLSFVISMEMQAFWVWALSPDEQRVSAILCCGTYHPWEKEMATHSSILAYGIPGTKEPGGLQSMGSHRVRHDWSNLAAAAAACFHTSLKILVSVLQSYSNQNSMVLQQKQTYRSMQQKRKPRNKPKHSWSTYLQ